MMGMVKLAEVMLKLAASITKRVTVKSSRIWRIKKWQRHLERNRRPMRSSRASIFRASEYW